MHDTNDTDLGYILIEYFKEYLQKELKGDFKIYSQLESMPTKLIDVTSAGYGIIIDYRRAASVYFETDMIHTYFHHHLPKRNPAFGYEMPYNVYSEESLHNTAKLVAKYIQEDINKCQQTTT